MLAAALLALALAAPTHPPGDAISGVVKSYDPVRRALVVDHHGHPMTVHLDRAATVFVEGRTGSLADLQPGAEVRTSLPASGKASTWVEVERGGRPSLRGPAGPRTPRPGGSAPNDRGSGDTAPEGPATPTPEGPATPAPESAAPGGGARTVPHSPLYAPLTERAVAPLAEPVVASPPSLPPLPAPGAPPLVNAPPDAAPLVNAPADAAPPDAAPPDAAPADAAKDAAGRVTRVDADDEKLSLRDERGGAVQLTVAPETTFFVEGRIGHLADLKPGDEVRTSYQPRQDGNVAAWVEVVRK